MSPVALQQPERPSSNGDRAEGVSPPASQPHTATKGPQQREEIVSDLISSYTLDIQQ